MTLLRRFLAYYRPNLGLFLLDFIAALVSGAIELGFPVAVKLFIDRLLPGQNWRLILLASTGLLVLYLVNAGLVVVVTYWGHMLGINIETEMRRKSFDHLQKLSFRFYDDQKTGHLVARVTRDLDDIGEFAHHGPEDIFVALMTFCGAFALMFAINANLAMLTAAIVPPIGFLYSRYGSRLTRTWQSIFAGVGNFNARIEQNIGGMRVVQAFGNEEHERKLFARENAEYRRTKLHAYRIMASSLSLNYFGTRIMQVVVMIAGTWFVLHGGLSAGGFVSFLLLLNSFFRPIDRINATLEFIPKGVAGFRRYTQLLDTAPDVIDRPNAINVTRLRGDIQFENVCFGYDQQRPVLRDVNLVIPVGETVAFVGPSGAGKTTLCSLLPRFYELDAGRITVDGIDIRDLSLHSLRRQIGIVQQDVFLFGGTIRENIAYGKLDANEDEIWQAATRAQLDILIRSLPEELDTIVGERGVKLSGGQKQRLAIARMFLKNPTILILDEATSALDTETERAIQSSLSELAKGRTTLVIAHRLATIRNADRIVVVDTNGVVEQGRHEELLAAGGLYHRLHEAQYCSKVA